MSHEPSGRSFSMYEQFTAECIITFCQAVYISTIHNVPDSYFKFLFGVFHKFIMYVKNTFKEQF